MKSRDFAKIALKNYGKVGTLTPSSKYVIKNILREIKPQHKVIVEYGAGDGIITKEILKILPSDGTLVAIELQAVFAQKLREIMDERLIIVEGDVVKYLRDLLVLAQHPKADIVISTLPFSLIKEREREEIIRNTFHLLSDGGLFIVCQHVPVISNSDLRDLFQNIKWRFEFRNTLPYFIISGQRIPRRPAAG